ncbi:MAG TPA: nucleoside monophosphate kinase [Verrucomicrobiae bacterium]|nr:nucleoside monophosphate kinase [Verrucomicrobiae bacterium]
MQQKFKTILLVGAPGSGKGTQGKLLGTLPGYVHSSSGDMFRALDRNSELGRIFMEYSTKGLLVPDDFTIRLWRDHMARLVASGKVHPDSDLVILDGIPRNVDQARMLDEHIEVTKLIVLRAFHNRGEMVRRLKSRALKENRPDDANEATIQRRLEVYDKESRPVVEYYPRDVRVDIDALQSPLEVAHDILSAILGRIQEIRKISPAAAASTTRNRA